MGLQGKTDLEDAEAQQDQADGPDQREDEFGQVVDHRKGVICRKSGHDKHSDQQDADSEEGIDPLQAGLGRIFHVISVLSLWLPTGVNSGRPATAVLEW